MEGFLKSHKDMSKQVEMVKLYRQSDGATKEFKKSAFNKHMKDEHLRRGFAIVADVPTKKVEEKPVDSIEKPKVIPPAGVEIEPTSPDSNDLSDLKVSELRELAQEKGVKGYANMKKVELIEALS